MAFNIDKFKSTIDKYGGIARNNLFEVQFSGFEEDSTITKKDLVFFCSSVVFPGITLNVFDYRPNNVELAQSLPFSMGHEQLECIFLIDDRHKVLEYFHSWMKKIVNYSVDGVMDGPADGTSISNGGTQYPYEFGYKEDYAQTMQIKKYSKTSELVYQCNIKNVYPVNLGSSTLSWDNNDSYSTLPIAFSYTDFKMIGTTPNISE